MKQFAKMCFLVALLLLVTGITAVAQSDTARLVGSVTDPTGAAISGATVTAVNIATNRTVSVQSLSTGDYVLNALPAGSYKVTIKKDAFKSETANIVLEISQVKTANFKLQVGSAVETVNVTDEVPLVDTATSSSGEIIQGRQVVDLPLNGRNFTQLALMTPGVSRGAYSDNAAAPNNNAETWRNSESGGAALAVNGLRPQANNYVLDGIDNNDAMVNSLVIFPAIEDINEFKTTTSVAPAEFGRAGGAVVQVQTKSGTNSYHGAVYWFNRSKEGAAIPWEYKTMPTLSRNQFGVSLGGKIWKDKLFGFVDYQGWRQNIPAGGSTTMVPTAKMRTGDFTELLSGTGAGTATSLPDANLPGCAAARVSNPTAFTAGMGYVFNPNTCLPFGWDSVNHAPGANINIIPSANQNPVGVKYLNAFPLPTPGLGNIVTNSGNFQAYQQNVMTRDDYDARVDYVASSKDTFFARYSLGQDLLVNTDALVDSTHYLPSSNGTNPQHPRQVAVGYTRILGNSLINEFHYGYSRPFYGYQQPKSGVPMAADLGIVNANTDPLLGGMPIIGGWYGNLHYVGDGGPYLVKQKNNQFTDTLSWTHGSHTIKAGVSILHRGVNWVQGNNAKGYFMLDDGDWGGLPAETAHHGTFTGDEASELMSGFVASYQIGGFNGYYNTRSWENGIFAQDDYRVNRKLTLNYGLRYDIFTWPTEAQNRQSNFDPSTGTLIEAGTTSGWNAALVNTPKSNFGPRLGFAYDVKGNGSLVVRGGYGLFYYLDRGGVANELSNNPDYNGSASYFACPTTATCATGVRYTLSGAAAVGATDATTATGALPSAKSISGIDPKNLTSANNVIYQPKSSPNSMIQQWNIQVETALTHDTSLNLAYVGTHMGNLATAYNANSTELGTGAKWFNNVGQINTYAMIGSGSYNGLQARVNRKMTHGLQYTLAYTWSHTLDNSNSALSNGAGGIPVGTNGVPLLHYIYGNSNSDQRQLFVASSIYELPFGRGRSLLSNISKPADLLVGGWQWSNVLVLAGGTPIDISGATSAVGGNGRPNYNGGCSVDVSYNVWMSCASGAFTNPGAGMIGNLARNYFHGPGTHTLDSTLSKSITVSERVKTEFRAQMYNLFNTPQFNGPNTNYTSGDFGKLTSTRSLTNRQLELALRVSF